MADALDLGSSGEIRRGSTPLSRTSCNQRSLVIYPVNPQAGLT
jgi:hypothetical protein